MIDAARSQVCGPGDGEARVSGDIGADRLSEASPTILGEYEVKREIHRGGQGVVYEATQRSTKRRVAIKVLQHGPLADPLARMRLEREVEFLGQLRHPNIVAVHHAGESHGSYYFVMDFVDGRPLDEFVADEVLGVRETLGLIATICKAVEAAHLKGIIHRDLKPSNIRIDWDGEPHVLDFGLAKAADAFGDVSSDRNITVTGQLMGSLPWMSPEQAAGHHDSVDVRTDVYALGVIAFQVLTGRLPLSTEGGVGEILDEIKSSIPPRPGSFQRNVDADVDAIVLKCLAKEPALRYQSAAALAEDLRRYLSGEPILARLPSTAYQIRKLIARHKFAFGLVGGLFVTAIVVAVWMSTLYGQAAAQSDRAEKQAEMTQAINDFLVDEMLSAATPDGAMGESIGVAEVLDNAARKVGAALHDQPLVEASVRVAIGQSYMSLGKFEFAEAQLRIGEQIHTRLLGDDDPATLLDRVKLVTLLRAQDRVDEAAPLCTRTYERCVRILGDEAETTLEAAGLRAWFYWVSGDMERGRDLYEKTLATARQILGNDHKLTIDLMIAWADRSLYATTRLETEALYRETLDAAQRTLGPNHPLTLATLSHLGMLLALQRRFEEAEPLLRLALTAKLRILGDHVDTVASMIHLGSMLAESARLDEAEAILRDAAAMGRRTVGDDHGITLEAMQTLGNTLMRQSRCIEAIPIQQQVLDRRRRLHGDRTVRVANLYDELGTCYLQLNHFAEAEQLFRESWRILDPSLAPDDRLRAGCLRRLVLSLIGQGKLAEARPFSEENLAIRRSIAENPNASAYELNCYARALLTINPVDLRDVDLGLEVAQKAHDISGDSYHYNRYTLALAHEAQGDEEEAIHMLKTALSQTPIEVSEDRTQYEDALVRLYEKVGDPSAAEGVYVATFTARRERFPVDHEDPAASLFDLGRWRLRHGNRKGAETALRDSIEILRNLRRESKTEARQAALECDIASISTYLAESLVAREQFEEAEKLLVEAHTYLADADLCHADHLRHVRAILSAVYQHSGNRSEAVRNRLKPVADAPAEVSP